MSTMWTSTQVCSSVGVTYRQLDHWCRSGLVTPAVPAAGYGSQRLFTAADVEVVRRIAGIAAQRRRPLAELVA